MARRRRAAEPVGASEIVRLIDTPASAECEPAGSAVVTVRRTVTVISFSYSRREEVLLCAADGRLIERRGSGR